ncbi:MAG: SRPBCC family protein [Chitinispirillaceae bacterium]|nr:SRPBCC family protein [Chitinispirillaceae bacterium]
MSFEKVSSEAVLPGCVRKEKAWNIISDYARYSAIMDNVDKVEIAERSGDEGISRWYVTVEEAPLYWVEKDHFNSRGFEITFKSIEGDFDNINGRWHIQDSAGDGIAIRFEIQYNLGIPVIEEVLGHILKEKMKTNIDKMMAAVRKELCCAHSDERKYPRHIIGQANECSFMGSPSSLFVLNLSAGGMMTRFVPGIQGAGAMDIASSLLKVAAVFPDESADRCRFVFREPLDDARLKQLVSRLAEQSQRRAA